jgi:hydrogenase maturation protein HypF
MAEGFMLHDGVLDFLPLLSTLAEPGLAGRVGANLLHGTVAAGIVAWVAEAARREGATKVALGGGCFANRVLAESVSGALRARGITPLSPRAVPAGDGGLSLGQAFIARAAHRRT